LIRQTFLPRPWRPNRTVLPQSSAIRNAAETLQDARQLSTKHKYETIVELSNGKCISGLRQPLATEIETRSLLTSQKRI
jgi:hypothetical protein